MGKLDGAHKETHTLILLSASVVQLRDDRRLAIITVVIGARVAEEASDIYRMQKGC